MLCSACRRSSCARTRVHQHGIGLQGARDHLAERHFAGVAVVVGLGHREEGGPRRVRGDLGGGGAGGGDDGRAGGRRGAELLDEAGQPVHAHPAGGRAAEHREDRARRHPAGQALLQLGVVERLPVQVALHQVVVAHDDALDQLLVHRVLLVDQVVGDGALVPGGRHGAVDGGAGGLRVVVGGRVVEQVDDAVEVGLVADRQLDRRHAGAEGLADLLQRAVEVGPLPVQLVDDDDPGQVHLRRRPPGVLGLGLHAVGGADHHHGQVDVGQGGDHLTGEVGVPGRVEQVHLDPVDREGGQAGRNGELPGHLLGFEVHDRRTLLHRPPPGYGPGARQQGLGQGGLSRTVVPDEGDVADCGRVVWHLVLRPYSRAWRGSSVAIVRPTCGALLGPPGWGTRGRGPGTGSSASCAAGLPRIGSSGSPRLANSSGAEVGRPVRWALRRPTRSAGSRVGAGRRRPGRRRGGPGSARRGRACRPGATTRP